MNNQKSYTEPLLINRITLKGIEIKKIFEFVKINKKVSYVQLLDRYVPKDNSIFSELNDDILKDSMGFLIGAKVLEVVNNNRSWINKSFKVSDKLNTEFSFQSLLLKNLLNMEDEKQKGLSIIHKVLVEKDIIHIQYNEIVKILERSEYSNLFSWNEEKINFWANLFDFCGLIRNLKGNGVWVIPYPQIILESLITQKKNFYEDKVIPINVWISFFENNFGSCLTKKGRLNRGFSIAFELLEEKNKIKLKHKDDSIQSIMVGKKRVSEVTIL